MHWQCQYEYNTGSPPYVIENTLSYSDLLTFPWTHFKSRQLSTLSRRQWCGPRLITQIFGSLTCMFYRFSRVSCSVGERRRLSSLARILEEPAAENRGAYSSHSNRGDLTALPTPSLKPMGWLLLYHLFCFPSGICFGPYMSCALVFHWSLRSERLCQVLELYVVHTL